MPQQRQYKILLIGDSCLDHYHYGHCKRLNPESSAPLLDHHSTRIVSGMCLNVLNNMLNFNHVSVDLMTNENKSNKHRYIDLKNNSQILRMDYDVKCDSLLFEDINLSGYDLVAISDYDKGYVSHDLIFQIVDKCSSPVFIDSKKANLPLNNCFIKVNENEYNNLKHKDLHENAIVTLGCGGATYLKKLYHTDFVSQPDVVGAGDTFFAAMICRYVETKNIDNSISFANAAANIAVRNSGTYALTDHDIKRLYRS